MKKGDFVKKVKTKKTVFSKKHAAKLKDIILTTIIKELK